MTETILTKDTIKIVIDEDHSFNCNAVAIGRAGENSITQLEITIPEELNSFWAYLDFKKPSNEKYKTSRLTIENNTIEYDVPLELLNEAGNLEVQLVLQSENGDIWKSSTKKYVILKSVDAVEDIPFQEDFITKAQNLLDEIQESGGGGIVDQTFNSKSRNAQSGISVEEARLSAVQEGKQYVDSVIGDINNVLATLVDIEGD